MASDPGAKFKDWPENLPREDLVRLLRGYANECNHVVQNIAAAFPDRYPLGDGENVPREQRVVIDESADDMSLMAAEEITELRAELSDLRREAADELARDGQDMRLDEARSFLCKGCGRHLPCRHCPDPGLPPRADKAQLLKWARRILGLSYIEDYGVRHSTIVSLVHELKAAEPAELKTRWECQHGRPPQTCRLCEGIRQRQPFASVSDRSGLYHPPSEACVHCAREECPHVSDSVRCGHDRRHGFDDGACVELDDDR